MKLDTVEVLWTLHLLPPENLPEVATELISDGIDCNALRLLAGLTPSEATGSNLFEEAIKELDRPPLSVEKALLRYVRLMSKEIIENKITPYDGAKRIWDASLELDVAPHEIDPFIYAASEYEDRPEDRGFFASEILQEAQRWVSGA